MFAMLCDARNICSVRNVTLVMLAIRFGCAAMLAVLVVLAMPALLAIFSLLAIFTMTATLVMPATFTNQIANVRNACIARNVYNLCDVCTVRNVCQGLFLAVVARFCNVKVLKFSVGFGKPIFSTVSKKSNTEYSLCMIPLGGYVQMLESKNAEGDSNNLEESEYKYCFDKKTVYQRFAIVSAGPIFNLILAIIFFMMTYLNGIGGIKPKIELANDSYQITSVNGTTVQRWQDVRVEILNNVLNNNKIKSHQLYL